MSLEPLISLSELPEVGAVPVDVDGRALAVVRAEDGSIHVIDDTCTHAEVSLAEGEVEDCSIECWLHGSRFDLRTGRPTGLPATKPIAVYRVSVEDDTVLADLSAPLTASDVVPSKEH
ncbi:MAG TPA: non-heme iron oxygenase ferredoxin subunit [Actinomycetales bacterium]|nr:non-heme iron oxygenase ferredoxin subunit [Actinomycetales bacterium]